MVLCGPGTDAQSLADLSVLHPPGDQAQYLELARRHLLDCYETDIWLGGRPAQASQYDLAAEDARIVVELRRRSPGD